MDAEGQVGKQRGGGKSFSQSSEKNGDDEFSGAHLKPGATRLAQYRMWWGGGCGDGRGLGAIPAPKFLVDFLPSFSGPLRPPNTSPVIFTGQAADRIAVGR